MVDRSVHVSVRGLVEGVVPPQGGVGASPGQKAQLGGFDIMLEAARERILPGEENEIVVVWKAREPGARAKVRLFLEVPAELAAAGSAHAAVEEWGAAGDKGEVRFRVTGVEPGGVWADTLLTMEDDNGMVLARARAGFGVARHRVVISGVDVEPPVVAAGGTFVVKARYAWTGQARVRGTIGGALRRREDGAELELAREKVSALGEREQEWRVRAPVDAAVADYDVELSFEAREAGARANFGKTSALAVRRPRDAEVVSVTPAKGKWGAEAVERVRAVVRNTGVEPLEGTAQLEVSVRLPGAAEPVIVARAAEPEHAPIQVGAAASAEVAFDVKLPRGVEGRGLEGRVVATFGSLTADRREVLGHVVADHVLEFDGFAADRFAYGPGEEARVECRVRDDGARPGGTFAVKLRLLAGDREVAAATAPMDLAGGSAHLVSTMRLPADLEARGALDLEVSVKEAAALRRVEGFLRLRQPVAARVAVVKPAPAHGRGAFLFDGEAVAEDVDLGEVEGAGAARLVVTDSPAYFVEVGGTPLAGAREAVERAASKAVAAQAGAPPPVGHRAEWERLLKSFEARAKGKKAVAGGGPSDLAERVAAGATLDDSGRASVHLKRAVDLTSESLGGGHAPAAEVASAWMAAAEAGAKAAGDLSKALPAVASALAAARAREAGLLQRLGKGGLAARELHLLAEAAVWRRALEAEFIAGALDQSGSDRVLQLSAALKRTEEGLRDTVRYYSRCLALTATVAEKAARDGAMRLRLAALRGADVRVKGAAAIVPGAYNEVKVEVELPRAAPAGGSVEAAVSLPSELWILASEGARLVRGHYLLRAAEAKPGSKAEWNLEVYVPERGASEPGAIEVRVGFEEEKA